MEHEDGVSPAWPISYDELSEYYTAAERLFDVHGSVGQQIRPRRRVSPEPPRPFVGHSPTIATIVSRMERDGLHPYELPVGVDAGPGGRCVLCSTCDGFPCQLRAKNDVEVRAVRPALESANVTLEVNCRIDRLVCSDGRQSRRRRQSACSTANRSRYGRNVSCSRPAPGSVLRFCSVRGMRAIPAGLANSSDQVGRNYMQHVFTALMARRPARQDRRRLPEDGRPERLLPRQPVRLPLGEHPGAGQAEC